MRRMLLAPALAGLLLLTACGSSGDQTRQTVIVTNTITSGAPTADTAAPGSSIQVGSPSEATSAESVPSESGSSSESAPSSPSDSPEATGVPQAGVDPISVACDGILDQDDVQQTLGAAILPGALKRPDVADPSRDVTDRSRCRYGSQDEGLTSQVTVLLTTYGSPESAATQVETTATVERNEGAKVSEVIVNGFPAYLMLRQGGLLTLQYGSWTLTIAVQDQIATEEALTTGLPELAGIVLNRIVANG